MNDESKARSGPATPPRDAQSSEQSLIDARRVKAERVRARGDNPFANDVFPRLGGRTSDIAVARCHADGPAQTGCDPAGRYDEARVRAAAGDGLWHVRGRVMALRSSGGLTFIRLRDRTGEIQLLLSQARLGEEYARLSEIDVGDIIEVEGPLTASKRGELSIETNRYRLLTKAYRPLPEKWHGLTDVELRYRQRYVDLVANPGVSDVFRARSHVVRATRAILDESGFLEVETPTMHTVIGGAAAKPFRTHHKTLELPLFMRIAPELYLTRLVVGGLERVYEIGRCYRNEGISTRHNPEFTMLEFYQAYATYDDLMIFTESLLRGIDARLAEAMPGPHAAWKEARPFDLDHGFERVPMEEAVLAAVERTAIPEWVAAIRSGGAAELHPILSEGLGEHIKTWAKASPRAKALDWGNFRRGFGKCTNDGERLFAAYEYVAEPFLTEDYRSGSGLHSIPVFIKDYPFETSPLARRSDARPELTDRFELFVHGRELCNAFSELNDPDDQADRFRAQVEKKARGDEECRPRQVSAWGWTASS